jgi:hypothetical protein
VYDLRNACSLTISGSECTPIPSDPGVFCGWRPIGGGHRDHGIAFSFCSYVSAHVATTPLMFEVLIHARTGI